MMLEDIFRHKLDYSILAILSGIFVIVFTMRLSSPRFLVIATMVFAFLYFVWGVWHHLRLKDLSTRIMLEYFLVAVLGIVIVSTLIL